MPLEIISLQDFCNKYKERRDEIVRLQTIMNGILTMPIIPDGACRAIARFESGQDYTKKSINWKKSEYVAGEHAEEQILTDSAKEGDALVLMFVEIEPCHNRYRGHDCQDALRNRFTKGIVVYQQPQASYESGTLRQIHKGDLQDSSLKFRASVGDTAAATPPAKTAALIPGTPRSNVPLTNTSVHNASQLAIESQMIELQRRIKHLDEWVQDKRHGWQEADADLDKAIIALEGLKKFGGFM